MAASTKERIKGMRKGPGRGKMPVKRSINLAGIGEEHIDMKIATPAIVLIVLAAMLLSKLAVVDPMMAVSRAQGEVSALQAQLDAGYAQVADFSDVEDQYAHYTYSGMTHEELSLADRVAVLQLIQRVVMPQVQVSNWSLRGNELTITITGQTLQQINEIAAQLQAEDMVGLCSVTNAATNSPYYNTWDEIRVDQTVTANLVVVLNESGEVQQG